MSVFIHTTFLLLKTRDLTQKLHDDNLALCRETHLHVGVLSNGVSVGCFAIVIFFHQKYSNNQSNTLQTIPAQLLHQFRIFGIESLLSSSPDSEKDIFYSDSVNVV